MKKRSIYAFICFVAAGIVSACGGIGSNQAGTVNPSVASITSGAVMYLKQSSFTVSGVALKDATVTASGACSALQEQVGGTSLSRTFSCTPSSVGSVTITVASGGTVLTQEPFTVPNPHVTIVTSKGTIVVELDPVKAPKTVHNFLLYVNDGYYSNTTFHRVIFDFVVQGGGFGIDGVAKPASHPTLELEPPSLTGLTNSQGTIAMARSSSLNSATSQFYFNAVNNNPNSGTNNAGTNLDLPAGQGYAVFGKVIQGLEIVKGIEVVPVTGSVPTTPVVLTSATQTL